MVILGNEHADLTAKEACTQLASTNRIVIFHFMCLVNHHVWEISGRTVVSYCKQQVAAIKEHSTTQFEITGRRKLFYAIYG